VGDVDPSAQAQSHCFVLESLLESLLPMCQTSFIISHTMQSPAFLPAPALPSLSQRLQLHHIRPPHPRRTSQTRRRPLPPRARHPRAVSDTPQSPGSRSPSSSKSKPTSRANSDSKPRPPRGKRGRRRDDGQENPPPPPSARPPSPALRDGFVGWREEDDAYWREVRASEKAFRGPRVPELDIDNGPPIPLSRHGTPIEFPAQVVYDAKARGWRPTTEEEELALREPKPLDPYFVPELKVGERPSSSSPFGRGGPHATQRSEWVNAGRDTNAGDKARAGQTTSASLDKSTNAGGADAAHDTPFSSLSTLVLMGGGSELSGFDTSRSQLRPSSTTVESPLSSSIEADRDCDEDGLLRFPEEPVRRRCVLDLPAGAWRVVNLGTSSAVPTKKRNVSCTAFIARPPASSSRPGSATESDASEAELREPSMFLVDAGENCSSRLDSAYWCSTHGFRWIRAVFITHLHGDHIYGLPSLLQNIGELVQFRRRLAIENGDDGSDPVIRIYGPHGIRGFLRTSLYWTPPLGCRFSVSELAPRDSDFEHLRGLSINSIGSKDEVFGVPPEEFPDLMLDSPPPHPDEVRADDVYASEDGLWHVWSDDDGSGVEVVAAPLKHRVPCFGYVFRESEAQAKAASSRRNVSSSTIVERPVVFDQGGEGHPEEYVVDVVKAKSLGVHGRQYSVLRSGRSVTIKKTGVVVSPSDVAEVFCGVEGARVARAGSKKEVPGNGSDLDVSPRKVVILGDTCDSSAIAEAARGADLMTHEATFANNLVDKARTAMHSTARMAGAFAKQIQARKLVLTHFSSRYESVHLAALITETEGSSSTTPASGRRDGSELLFSCLKRRMKWTLMRTRT
jgi:ribonuclease Z